MGLNFGGMTCGKVGLLLGYVVLCGNSECVSASNDIYQHGDIVDSAVSDLGSDLTVHGRKRKMEDVDVGVDTPGDAKNMRSSRYGTRSSKSALSEPSQEHRSSSKTRQFSTPVGTSKTASSVSSSTPASAPPAAKKSKLMTPSEVRRSTSFMDIAKNAGAALLMATGIGSIFAAISPGYPSTSNEEMETEESLAITQGENNQSEPLLSIEQPKEDAEVTSNAVVERTPEQENVESAPEQKMVVTDNTPVAEHVTSTVVLSSSEIFPTAQVESSLYDFDVRKFKPCKASTFIPYKKDTTQLKNIVHELASKNEFVSVLSNVWEDILTQANGRGSLAGVKIDLNRYVQGDDAEAVNLIKGLIVSKKDNVTFTKDLCAAFFDTFKSGIEDTVDEIMLASNMEGILTAFNELGELQLAVPETIHEMYPAKSTEYRQAISDALTAMFQRIYMNIDHQITLINQDESSASQKGRIQFVINEISAAQGLIQQVIDDYELVLSNFANIGEFKDLVSLNQFPLTKTYGSNLSPDLSKLMYSKPKSAELKKLTKYFTGSKGSKTTVACPSIKNPEINVRKFINGVGQCQMQLLAMQDFLLNKKCGQTKHADLLVKESVKDSVKPVTSGDVMTGVTTDDDAMPCVSAEVDATSSEASAGDLIRENKAYITKKPENDNWLQVGLYSRHVGQCSGDWKFLGENRKFTEEIILNMSRNSNSVLDFCRRYQNISERLRTNVKNAYLTIEIDEVPSRSDRDVVRKKYYLDNPNFSNLLPLFQKKFTQGIGLGLTQHRQVHLAADPKDIDVQKELKELFGVYQFFVQASKFKEGEAPETIEDSLLRVNKIVLDEVQLTFTTLFDILKRKFDAISTDSGKEGAKSQMALFDDIDLFVQTYLNVFPDKLGSVAPIRAVGEIKTVASDPLFKEFSKSYYLSKTKADVNKVIKPADLLSRKALYALRMGALEKVVAAKIDYDVKLAGTDIEGVHYTKVAPAIQGSSNASKYLTEIDERDFELQNVFNALSHEGTSAFKIMGAYDRILLNLKEDKTRTLPDGKHACYVDLTKHLDVMSKQIEGKTYFNCSKESMVGKANFALIRAANDYLTRVTGPTRAASMMQTEDFMGTLRNLVEGAVNAGESWNHSDKSNYDLVLINKDIFVENAKFLLEEIYATIVGNYARHEASLNLAHRDQRDVPQGLRDEIYKDGLDVEELSRMYKCLYQNELKTSPLAENFDPKMPLEESPYYQRFAGQLPPGLEDQIRKQASNPPQHLVQFLQHHLKYSAVVDAHRLIHTNTLARASYKLTGHDYKSPRENSCIIS